MKTKKLTLVLLAVLLNTIVFHVQAQDKLTVYAASSMTNAVNDLVKEFEKTSRIATTTVYAGTSSLARQIEQGAPADLFISANKKWVNYLIKKQIVNSDAVTELARNQLVVVSPIGHTDILQIDSGTSWLSYLKGGRLAIGQTNAVPAGIYAKESLESLAVWQDVKFSLAPTNNVRIALTLVERAEAPLGIVYKTDALMSSEVKIVANLPDTSHQPITYPLVQLNAKPQTQQFADFLQTPKARNILLSYGFQVDEL